MWQNIIVALVLILAVIFTARKFYRSFRQTDKCSCRCGCPGGETSNSCSASNRLFILDGDKENSDK